MSKILYNKIVTSLYCKYKSQQQFVWVLSVYFCLPSILFYFKYLYFPKKQDKKAKWNRGNLSVCMFKLFSVDACIKTGFFASVLAFFTLLMTRLANISSVTSLFT